MRRIAGKENATVSPFIGDARIERVNHAPFDWTVERSTTRKQPPDAVVAQSWSGFSPANCMNSQRTRDPTAGSRRVGRRGSQKNVMLSTP